MATNTYVLWTEYGKEEHIKDVLTNTILRDHQEHTTLYVPKKMNLYRSYHTIIMPGQELNSTSEYFFGLFVTVKSPTPTLKVPNLV